MIMRYYKDSWQYKRLMQILDDYWLTVPDEKRVEIRITFLKADGQTQEKTIIWNNPKYAQKGQDYEEVFKEIEEAGI